MPNNINQFTIPDHTERFRMLKKFQDYHQSLQVHQLQADLARATYESILKMKEVLENQKKAQKDPVPEELCPIPLVVARLQEAENTLASVDQEIGSIRSVLEQFNAQLPIRRCPSDILELIFESYLELSSTNARFEDTISLTHVCYRWHEIAVNLSTLWLTVPAPLHRGATRINGMWTKISSRAKGNPVRITISSVDNNDYYSARLQSIYEYRNTGIYARHKELPSA